MNSPLDNLAGHSGSLAVEPPDRNEFNGLKRSGLARLHDAANTGLSLESRFDLAYNAAHALCLAALRSHGYRPKKSLHRISSGAAYTWIGPGSLANLGKSA